MLTDVENIQQIGKAQLEAMQSVSASITKGLQLIAAEATEFMKSSIEGHSAYVEKLLRAKSLEDLTQVQSEFTKINYERLVEQGAKIRKLYTNIAQETFTPLTSKWGRWPTEPAPDLELAQEPPAKQLPVREKAKRRREALAPPTVQNNIEDYSAQRP